MARKDLWSWLKSLIVAVILALVIRHFLLAFYVVDGNSMLPTLQDGQMVAVNKISYRFSGPKHGDVVVFKKEGEAGLSEDRVFIKRIIALPGDIIEIRAGDVYLNGQIAEEKYIDAKIQGDFGPLFIQENLVFVMGDNRHPDGSWDSRRFGPVPLDTILGRADIIIFPIPGRVH